MATNSEAQVGDVLVLTKPLGSGVIATALKKGAANEDVIAAAVQVMERVSLMLNYLAQTLHQKPTRRFSRRYLQYLMTTGQRSQLRASSRVTVHR